MSLLSAPIEFVSTIVSGLTILGIVAFVGLIIGTIAQEFWIALRGGKSSCDIVARLNTATWLLIATEVVLYFAIALRHFCLDLQN